MNTTKIRLIRDTYWWKWIKNNKSFINIVLILLVFFFIFRYTYNLDFNSLRNISLNYGFLLLIVSLNLLSLSMLPIGWILLIKEPDFKINLIELYSVYFKAWLGRYIPGKVAWIGGKYVFGKKLGISEKKLAFYSFLEPVLILASGFTLFLFLLLKQNILEIKLLKLYVTLFLIVGIIIYFLSPILLNKIYFLIKKRSIKINFVHYRKKIFFVFLYFIFVHLLFGSAFASITLLFDIKIANMNEFIYLIQVSVSSTISGMISIFSPSGIGIKEGTQIYLLNKIMNKENAFLYSLISRFSSLFSDIFMYFLVSLFGLIYEKNEK